MNILREGLKEFSDALLVEDDPAACGVIPPHAHAPNRIDEMPADGAAGVIPITASSTSAHNILEHARQEVTNTIREEAGQAKEAASQKVKHVEKMAREYSAGSE